jgi:omega-6 fatty acid desaturase (delta-12 desaturase)
LCSRIPYYRLPRVLRDNPELGTIGRLTLWESVKCVRLTLWDESNKKLISFRELRRMQRTGQARRSSTAMMPAKAGIQ